MALCGGTGSLFTVLLSLTMFALPIAALVVDMTGRGRDMEWKDANPLAGAMMCEEKASCIDDSALVMYRVLIYIVLASEGLTFLVGCCTCGGMLAA